MGEESKMKSFIHLNPQLAEIQNLFPVIVQLEARHASMQEMLDFDPQHHTYTYINIDHMHIHHTYRTHTHTESDI